ncbi:hypothetical protein [Hymenobacter wooponensis]|uniref:Gliding motility lipoprotein GldH n=1 Tax=Hymenobacter wooponensis TaxID=1525360 RepID=A0A4Z0MCD3_9BACT|nr:hypothetical protein [Hymenobacter wooponensis]TGD77136.1 hypothetical protein EU557_24185 [Hymenobacter wooponensis]
MREFITMLLLAVSILFAGCSTRPTAGVPVGNEQNSAHEAVQWELISADSGQTITLGPDPTLVYREVQLSNVVAGSSAYSAFMLCNQDSLGTLHLLVQLDTQRHSIKKLELLYIGNTPKHKLKQIGDGVGHYDAKDQRYYFDVAYQTISELPENIRFFSSLYQINGWISTETATAGLQPLRIAD